ncbi:MAG: type II toxin-antitoxin system PemK/MazF family toxin [Saprospiraceae bacterium]|nr:type II toxin-antitoxin system PemK/MazF family toxin [Saprospiraceae bacterium]
MARFIKGEVVVIPFPFSDLSGSKRRPALVLADLPGDDIILCQITSQKSPKDPFAIPLINTDFISGSLPVASNIRPNRIFAADSLSRNGFSIDAHRHDESLTANILLFYKIP